MNKRTCNHFKYLFFFLSMIMAVSCTDEQGNADESEDTEDPINPGTDSDDAQLILTTYNTGLAVGFVDYADQREPMIADAIAGLTADVVCLQEVWNEDQIQSIALAAETTFPHQYYELTSEDESDAGTGEASCNDEETENLGGCVREACSEVAPTELSGCVISNCLEEFNSVSTECSGCLVANLGKTIDEILDTCSVPGGGSMAYGGRNGLLLLSRHPLSSTEYLVLPSFLNRRAVLHARVEKEHVGPVDVFCTHLTANLSAVTYAGEYASWEDERAAQIGELFKYIDQTKDSTGFLALLGDMNCGPEAQNINPEFPDNFQLFINGQMLAPYLAVDSPPCTWCSENPLTGGADSGGNNSIIDHILIQNAPASATYDVSRILDNEITLNSGNELIPSRLSDHYGVRVSISLQ